MPIILAIEPDRRQAAHLTGVVRQKVAAELILAETTEGALDAIGNRVPDMVLVPALLSPQDDAALAAALRVIAAAARVRTLTIPVLASGAKFTKPGGMLAKWRRGRTESPAPDGCEPSVFAEQINAYLREAAAERAELESELDKTAATETVPIGAAQPLEMAATDAIELATPDPIAFAEPDPIALAKPEPVVLAAPEPIVLATPEPFVLAAPEPFVLATPEPFVLTAPEPIVLATPEPFVLAAPEPFVFATPEPFVLAASEPFVLATSEPFVLAAPEPFVLATSEPVGSPVVEPIETWAAEGFEPPAPTEPIEQVAAVAPVEDEVVALIEDESRAGSDAASEAIVDGQLDIDLSAELDGLSEESLDEKLFAGEPVGIYTISSAVEEAAMEAFDLLPAILEPAPIAQHPAASVADATVDDCGLRIADCGLGSASSVVEELVVQAPVVEALVVQALVVEAHVVEDVPAEDAETPRSDVEPWVPMYLTPGRMWPPLEGMLAEAATSLDEFQAHPEDEPIAAFVQVEIAQPEARPEPTPERSEPLSEPRPAAASPKPDHPEWHELIASLRQDIQRRRGEPASRSVQPIAARPADSGDGNENRHVKKQKPFGKKSKPVQDEWGFFDPEQCGFSALLAKLEEITDPPPEESDARRPS